MWKAVFSGDEHGRIIELVEEIAASLEKEVVYPSPESEVEQYAFLSRGDAGITLLYYYLGLAKPGEGHEEVALDLLDRAIEGIASTPLHQGLFRGIPGVAWVVEHVRNRLLDGEDLAEEVAAAIEGHLRQRPWEGDHSLLHGLVGLGVYALERMPSSSGVACLSQVLELLAETAEEVPPGLSWKTRADKLLPHVRASNPEGNYNLGMALGVPGILGFLGRLGRDDHVGRDVRRLLEGAIEWVLAQRNTGAAVAEFPFTVSAQDSPSGPQLGWCYGDLPIATALLTAGRGAGVKIWSNVALEIASTCVERPILPMKDACLCHGTAGIGFLYSRLYNATGDERYRAAAQEWFRQTLDSRTDGGLAGFLYWRPDKDGKYGWRNDPGLLTGVAGTALCLLAACTEVEPAWDRLFLLSIPDDIGVTED